MAKILIVDDDVDFIGSTAALLEHEGHQTITALNGQDGYAKAKQEKPDVVLLDVMMKTDSEGFEIARQLRADPETSRMPIILITGIRKAKNLPFSFEPDEDWLPVTAVLEKPVKPEALVKSVQAALS